MLLVCAIILLFAAQPPDVFYREGVLALQKNDLATARRDLEAAAKVQSGNARVWLALAQTYWKQRDKDASELAARKAESLGTNDAAVQRGLAIYYFEVVQEYLSHEQFDPAIQLLERGTHIVNKDAQLELALGVAYYGRRRFSDAVTAFVRTIDLAPEVEQPYRFLGKMLDQAGDRLPEITRRFAAWSAANPRNALAHLLYAKALIAAGMEAPKAEKLLRDATALKSDDWESHYELGVLLEKQRKFAEAAGELEHSIALNPNRPEVHYHLARVYDRLGASAKAAEEHRIHQKLTTVAEK